MSCISTKIDNGPAWGNFVIDLFQLNIREEFFTADKLHKPLCNNAKVLGEMGSLWSYEGSTERIRMHMR